MFRNKLATTKPSNFQNQAFFTCLHRKYGISIKYAAHKFNLKMRNIEKKTKLIEGLIPFV